MGQAPLSILWSPGAYSRAGSGIWRVLSEMAGITPSTFITQLNSPLATPHHERAGNTSPPRERKRGENVYLAFARSAVKSMD